MKQLLGIALLLCAACAPKALIQPAYDHFTTGTYYENEGRLNEALAEYRSAHKLNPYSKEILTSLIKLLYETGRYDEALPYARRLTKIEPNDYNSFALLGNIYIQLGKTEKGITAFKRRLAMQVTDDFIYSFAGVYEGVNKLNEALALYEKLTARNPRSISYLFAEANTLRKLKRYDQALVRYREVAALDSSFTLVYLGLGICFEEKRSADSAVAMYEHYRQYQPKDTLVRKRLVELYVRLKRFDEGLALAQEVLGEIPFDLDMHQLAGYAWYKTGKTGQALHEFLIACGIEPKDAYSLLHIGKILADEGNYKLAEQYLQRAKAAKPDVPETWTTLGLLYYETKQYRDAVRAFRQAIKLKGNRSDNYYFIGLVWEARKDSGRALQYYRESLKSDPHNAKAWLNLAMLYDQLNQTENAIDGFRRVVELDSENASALNYIAYIYAEQGDSLDQALRLIQKALAREPDNGYFIDTEGWIYFKQRRYEDAIRALERAIGIAQDAVIYDHLGEAYDKAGNREKALEMWKKALELYPGNEKIRAKIEAE